jgi:hypothetical protein
VKGPLTLILLLAAQTCSMVWLPSSSNLVGKWRIDIKFLNAGAHSLCFEAQASGKGSFLLQDSRSNLLEAAEPTEAKWTQSGDKKVAFSGSIEFPIGNVGRDSGTLVFKGTFEAMDAISGDVAFFPLGQDPSDPKATPSRIGTFKAKRLAAD